MTWALMIAGAETIVAAKWEVDSETTTRAMGPPLLLGRVR